MKGKSFLILFFAGVAAFAAISIYFLATVDRADKIVTEQVSPNGRLKAVRVSVAGGGGQPFCWDSISVMRAVYPNMFAEKSRNYEVYNAPCDRPNRAASPKAEWLSDTELRITYSPGLDANAVRATDIDVTKSVRVTFATRQ